MAEPWVYADLAETELTRILALDDETLRASALAELAETLYLIALEDHGGDDASGAAAFVASMAEVFERTVPDGTPEQITRVAAVLGTAAANASFIATIPSGATVTWQTRRDDAVRETHVPLEGVTQAAGTPFQVGGFPLYYPGQPVGPPELWMNCRCTLAVTAAVGLPPAAPAAVIPQEVSMTSSTPNTTFSLTADPDSVILNPDEIEPDSLVAVSDKPWSQFSASDYSIEQWRRACLLKMPDGDPESKSTYKLPVREPGGALNRNGVHAAAAALGGARGGVDAPAEAKAAAKRKLRGLYKQLGEQPPDSLAADLASGSGDDTLGDSLIAVDTHDAPGWITNPQDTQRLRNYWTKGEGALKIRWGQPGDFNRCRRQLAKYVNNPQWLAGTCANLHYVALGFWPGQGPHASAGRPHLDELDPPTAAVTAAFEAADAMDAEGETMPLPPREWFDNPELDGPTPLTVIGDGRVIGHLATWGTCHVGLGGCIEAPRSMHDYAYFRTGEVETTEGPVPVGQITMDTGHAAQNLAAAETIRHYDDTGTVVADVAAGEDEHGIWMAGAVRPGINPAQMRALRAGAPSGDWRRIGGNLELVAALMVNVPGYPVPRPMVASMGETVLALTAAAVVVDANAREADDIATLVVAKLDERESARTRAARVRSLRGEINKLRVAELVASVEG